MNSFAAKAEWQNGAWRALVRYVSKAEFFPVMDGDRPAAFPTAQAAELEAHRELTRHINTTIRSSGERSPAWKAADRHFRIKGRIVEVRARA